MDSMTAVEQSVLGLALTDHAHYIELADELRADDFGVDAHRAVWTVLGELYREGESADVTTITAVLEKRGQLVAVGGRDYLVDLTLAAGAADAISTYGKMLHAEALRRRMNAIGLEYAGKALVPNNDPFQIHREMIQAVLEVEYGRGPQFKRVDEILVGYEQEIYDRFDKPVTVVGTPTGFPALDRINGGYKPGVHILGARTSIGKTAWALSSTLKMAERGVRVAIFTLEMLEKDLTNRLLAMRSGVPTYAIEHGRFADGHLLTNADKDLIRDALDWLKRMPIFINPHPAPTTSDIRVSLQRLIAALGVDIAIIDHIHLMSDDDISKGKRESLVQMYTNISRNLKYVAKDLQIPLLILAQLNRASTMRQDRHPQLTDLRESGSIEQDAQLVYLLHREDPYHKHDKQYSQTHMADFEVAKNQLGGMTDVISFYYDEKVARFHELATNPLHP